MAAVTIAMIRKTYTSFKRKYYQGFDLPPAREVKFRWVPQGEIGEGINCNRHLGMLITDGDKRTIELNAIQRTIPCLLWTTLLHEMSHIAKPRLDHGPGWLEEADRLGQLGAMKEIF